MPLVLQVQLQPCSVLQCVAVCCSVLHCIGNAFSVASASVAQIVRTCPRYTWLKTLGSVASAVAAMYERNGTFIAEALQDIFISQRATQSHQKMGILAIQCAIERV